MKSKICLRFCTVLQVKTCGQQSVMFLSVEGPPRKVRGVLNTPNRYRILRPPEDSVTVWSVEQGVWASRFVCHELSEVLECPGRLPRPPEDSVTVWSVEQGVWASTSVCHEISDVLECPGRLLRPPEDSVTVWSVEQRVCASTSMGRNISEIVECPRLVRPTDPVLCSPALFKFKHGACA